MTLEQALDRALKNNAELKVMRAEVEVYSASVALAHPWSMPELRLQFNNVASAPTGNYNWYVGLSWQPPNPWEWSHGVDAAQARLLDARFDLAARSWQVIKNLRLAWLDVSGAAAHEQLATETIQLRHRMLELMQKRLEQGASTQVEINLAQLFETDARQEQLRWQGAGLKGTQSVAYLVGEPVAPVPSVLPALPPELPRLEDLETRLDAHPVLEALKARVSMAESNAKTLAAKRLPWPEVSARFRHHQSDNLNNVNNDLQVGLTLPLGVTPAPELEVARAQITRNRAQLDAQKAQMRSELVILLSRAEGLRDRWLSFEKDFSATLASHRQLQERVLAQGTLDPALLMTADRQAIDLQHKRLEVRLDLARTLVELEAVAGPPPQDAK
jgi:outer membrane protein TolC